MGLISFLLFAIWYVIMKPAQKLAKRFCLYTAVLCVCVCLLEQVEL